MASRPKSGDLRIEGLAVAYGKTTVLRDVSLSVAEGSFLALLGPSGSGKTTLLHALAGFVATSAGRIWLGEEDVTELLPEQRGFGMVFQGYALFPHLTVAENIVFSLRVRRLSKADRDARLQRMLALVQLKGLEHRRPGQLSGGQQQRAALARALAFEPRVLLLDEPMSALDRQLRSTMQAEIRGLHRRLGTTFITVTHDQDEAFALADQVAVLRDGALVQVGTPRDLYSRPTSRFVAEFVGDGSILRGCVTAQGSSGTLDFAGVQMECADSVPLPDGMHVGLLLRPGDMTVHPKAPGMQGVHGVVIESIDLGDRMRTVVDVGPCGTAVVEQLGEYAPQRVGCEVLVNWPRDRGRVVDRIRP